MGDTTRNAEADDAAGTASPRELLQAGAVLPVGTADVGEHATRLTARSYQHGGLEGRTVVRLVAAELVPAEDAAAGFLGLEPLGEPAVVGLGLPQALGFPEWVLVRHPEDGHHALAMVPELDRLARAAKSKPKAAFDGYQALAKELAAAVPHFLPTFYEQAGRVFVGLENATYAAQMFSRARAADAEYGLPIDEDRLDAVFLEFALAGALPVKVLAGYGRDLATRMPPQEALDRFTRLCIRRTAGGMTPSAQMATELRKLAKAAGSDADAVEQRYLAELLGLSATLHAPTGWWKAHRPALIALATQDSNARRALLEVMPSSRDNDLPETWLGVLLESGAADALHDPAQPEEQRPADGALGWLRRFEQLRMHNGWWHGPKRMPALYPLVEKCAPRLREELARERATAAPQAAATPTGRRGRRHEPAPGTLAVPHDVDLLDLLLATGIPVEDPQDDAALPLDTWADGEGQRDLRTLAADRRFRPAFHQGVRKLEHNADKARIFSSLSATPGGREMLAETVATIAGNFGVAGLPGLPDAIEQLSWLPGEALALAEDAVRAAVRTDLAPVLARTLHAGLFDELCWPDWDKAVAELVSPKAVQDIYIVNAWPYLIVSGDTQARVLGAEGTALTHDLRIPQNDRASGPGLRYVDGELLVYWKSLSAVTLALRGYWHTSADRIQPMKAHSDLGDYHTMDYYSKLPFNLPLTGGGRTTGRAPIHRGDTFVPGERPLMSDGTSYWVYADEGTDQSAWREFDPATGEVGRASLPGFVEELLRAAPGESAPSTAMLVPAPTAEAGPAARPVNGLYGWCTVTLPDGSVRGQDLSGLTVSVPEGSDRPVRALMFPGANRPTALTQGHYSIALVDPDGVTTSTTRTDARPEHFARGTALLPPIEFWHFMRPRDPEGSAALRRIDRDGAAALLEGARRPTAADEQRARASALVQGGQPADAASSKRERVAAAIHAALPQVTDDALIAGISGVVRYTAAQQLALDNVATQLEAALSAKPRKPAAPAGPPGPADTLLDEPLRSLGADGQDWDAERSPVEDAAFQQIRLIGQARREPAAPFPPGKPHMDGTRLPQPSSDWWSPMLGGWSALAYRAASPATTPETAAALLEFLREFDAAGLAASTATSPWRVRTLRLAKARLPARRDDPNAVWRGILPQADGAFIACVSADHNYSDSVFRALQYDPTGEFAAPAPYEASKAGAVGEERPDGWLAAFLALCAERGPVPWFPEAAPEFARLTGVTPTQATWIVAGLPNLGNPRYSPYVTPDLRRLIGAKAADAEVARIAIRNVGPEILRRVLAGLTPDDPARLWAEGPDVAAAAEVWNRRVGRRVPVPEWLLDEGRKAAVFTWELPTVLGPAASAALNNDLPSVVKGDRVGPRDRKAVGFDADTLIGAVAAAAWLAHRLPAGDPLRASLPEALERVRARLAYPELMLGLSSYVDLGVWRKAAGTPTEVGEGYERYGAVIMPTRDKTPKPAVKLALLDEVGDDPYLGALRTMARNIYGTRGQASANAQDPFPVIATLRLARDPAFARLMQDPGEPAAGERDADGTWAPQDPSRSVPDLVLEVAKEYGLGEDAAALYLMLLAMPDPTDQNTRRWTGWKAPRMAAAHAELAATDLVIEGVRARAKRTLFLPGDWAEPRSLWYPFEPWKLPLLGGLAGADGPVLGVLVPAAPAAEVYRTAWQRVRDGDTPRFGELRARPARGRRR